MTTRFGLACIVHGYLPRYLGTLHCYSTDPFLQLPSVDRIISPNTATPTNLLIIVLTASNLEQRPVGP